MKDVFRSKSVPTWLKVNIFEAACVSILLYGCESWIIGKKLNNTLNSFATNCYIIMLGIKRIDSVSNDIFNGKVGRDKLTLQIQQRLVGARRATWCEQTDKCGQTTHALPPM
jgi:hypothetical protein